MYPALVAAPSNLSFETAGATAGSADGWTVTIVSSAVEYSNFNGGSGAPSPAETYEFGWNNDDYLLVLTADDKEGTGFDGDVIVTPVFAETYERWITWMPVLSSYATASFLPYQGIVEDYELGWPSIAIEAQLDGGDAPTGIYDTVAPHLLGTDQPVRLFRTTGYPPGYTFIEGDTYFVIALSDTTLSFAATPGGAAVVASSGLDNMFMTPVFMTELGDNIASASINGGTTENYETGWGADTYLTTLGPGDKAAAVFSGDFADVAETYGRILADVTIASIDIGTNTFTVVASATVPGNGTLVTLETTSTRPGGVLPGEIYEVYNRSSTTFQLSLPGAATAIDIVDIGEGTHRLRGDPLQYWTSDHFNTSI